MNGDTLALQPDEETIIIAERNNAEAWIQSDTTVSVGRGEADG